MIPEVIGVIMHTAALRLCLIPVTIQMTRMAPCLTSSPSESTRTEIEAPRWRVSCAAAASITRSPSRDPNPNPNRKKRRDGVSALPTVTATQRGPLWRASSRAARPAFDTDPRRCHRDGQGSRAAGTRIRTTAWTFATEVGGDGADREVDGIDVYDDDDFGKSLEMPLSAIDGIRANIRPNARRFTYLIDMHALPARRVLQISE